MGKSKLLLVVCVHPRRYLQNRTDFALLWISKESIRSQISHRSWNLMESGYILHFIVDSCTRRHVSILLLLWLSLQHWNFRRFNFLHLIINMAMSHKTREKNNNSHDLLGSCHHSRPVVFYEIIFWLIDDLLHLTDHACWIKGNLFKINTCEPNTYMWFISESRKIWTIL